jgi:hypothetical protein
MPVSKPTSLPANPNTGHTNYGTLKVCIPFLDGSGTTVSDIMTGAYDGTVTFTGTGAWNTSVSPYSLVLDDNNGAGNCTSIANTAFTWATSKDYTIVVRFRCDVIDPTGGYPAYIVSGENYSQTTPVASVGIYVMSDDTIRCVIANANGSRVVSGIPYEVGVDGWVIIHLVYDFTSGSGYSGGAVTAYLDGVSYAQTSGPGDRPGYGVAPDGPLYFARPTSSGELTQCGWDGELDIFYVYETKMSSTDVSAMVDDIYAVLDAGGGATISKKKLMLLGVS